METDKKFMIEPNEFNPLNGEIWNQVCSSEMFTDDLGTLLKQVKYGDRQFTSIDAYVQVKKLTELFGPCGKGWGIKEVEKIFDCPMTKHTKRGSIEGTQVMFKFIFWWNNGSGRQEIMILNDIFLDASGDCGKKLTTDCITKAASYLGFNYDVFCGRFNDAKTISSPATKEERDALMASMAGLKEERKKSVIDFHEKHGWKKDEVRADTEKFLELKAKVEAMKKDTPAEEA